MKGPVDHKSQLKCYEFNSEGIVFHIAHTDEPSARDFAEKECGEEEVGIYKVTELSTETMGKIIVHDDEDGWTGTMAEYLDRHNEQFPGQAALLTHSEI
jgi:hypothetical protein